MLSTNYTLIPTEDFTVGDIKSKLEVYRKLDGFDTEIRLLEAALPIPVPASQIEFNIGSAWIPLHIYEAWCVEYFNVLTKWYYSDTTASWDVRVVGGDVDNSANTALWGYSWCRDSYSDRWDCIPAIGEGGDSSQGLVQMLLSFKTPLIRVAVQQGDQKTEVKSSELTNKAIAHQRKLGDEFQKWCRMGERGEQLAAIYNDIFNREVLPSFDGAGKNFELHGMSEEWKHKARLYQKDEAVAATKGNHLNGLEVGLGKTISAAISINHRLYTRTATKALVVVQKSTLKKFGRELKEAYPNTNVIVAPSDACSKPKRLEFLAKIAFQITTGIVVMTHDSFDAIPMRSETERKFIQERLKAVEEEISWYHSQGEFGTKQKGRGKPRANQVVKKLEAKRNEMKAQITELTRRQDCGFYFEDLGIDYLVVDECDRYARDSINSRLKDVVGVCSSESQRAQLFALKCDYMNSRFGEKALLFMTGTPAPDNWLGEVYIYQRYLQPSLMKKRGVYHFDAWARTFARITSNLEVKPCGSLAITPRFGAFVNVKELQKMWLQVCRVRRYKHVEEQIEETGKRPSAAIVEVVCQPSELQQRYMMYLMNRYDAWRHQDPWKWERRTSEGYLVEVPKVTTKKIKDKPLRHPVTKQPISDIAEAQGLKLNYQILVDGVFKQVGESKQCMLEPKLLDPRFLKEAGCDENPPINPDGKLMRCVDLLVENFRKDESQLVFCDMGTPGGSSRFPVYEFIKNECVKRGIERDRIAFIHDAKTDEDKEALFEKVNNAEVNILIMSTQKGGIGVNCQEQVPYTYFLDIPPKPSWFEQRVGRMVRSGNRHKNVTIYQFLTQGGGKGNYGADAFYFQLCQTKAQFREQLWDINSTVRVVEDDAGSEWFLALTAQSSGDPALQEYCKVEAEYRKVRSDRDSSLHNINHWETSKQGGLPGLKEKLGKVRSRIQSHVDDIALAQKADVLGDKFQVIVNGLTYQSTDELTPAKLRTQADAALQQAVAGIVLEAQKAHVTQTAARKIGEYGGFDIDIIVTLFGDRYEVESWLQGDGKYRFKWLKSNKQLLVRLEQCLIDIGRTGEVLEKEEDELIGAIASLNTKLVTEKEQLTQLEEMFDKLTLRKVELEQQLNLGN
jgi:hypothetical protein